MKRATLIVVVALLCAVTLNAQNAAPMPTPKQQFMDNNGLPLVGGKLYSYAAGTSTPLATYTDSTATVKNTNPVTLDAGGRAAVWLSGAAYKLVLKDSDGATIWTADNIVVSHGTPLSYKGSYDALVSYDTGNIVTYSGATYFSLIDGNQGNQPDINATKWQALTAYPGVTTNGSNGLTISGTPSASTDADTVEARNSAISSQLSAGTSPAVFTTVSTDTQINVLRNKYGVALVADGSTDNCYLFASMQAAVASGATLIFPKGSYAISQSSCASGLLITKPLTLIFEDGAKLIGPLNGNGVANVTIKGLTTDCSTWSGACDGISSGAAATTAGGWRVENYTYIGPSGYIAAAAHGVLLQSGANNYVHNVKANNVFHVVAVRSPMTVVDGVRAINAVDVIVKSYTDSGDVYNVALSDIQCFGDNASTKNGCMINVTAQASGVNTYNVSITNASFYNAAYGLVLTVDDGGNIFGVTATNLTGFNMTTPLYAYTNSGAHTCSNVQISNSNFQNSTSTGFENPLGCLNVGTNGVRINGSLVPQVFGQIFSSNINATPASGTEGVRITPASDSDTGDPAIGTTNAAGNSWNWMVTKGGLGTFSALKIGSSAGVDKTCAGSPTAMTVTKGIITAVTCP